MPRTKPATTLRGVIPALAVFAIGVLALLHNLGVVHFGDLRHYWPLLVITAGVYWVLDPKSRAVGIVALLVGVALQASNLGLIRMGALLDFWPLILIAVGIHLLAGERARKQGDWMGGAIVLTLGVIFQLQALGLFGVSIERFWPVVIIVAGLGMLLKVLRSRGNPQ